MLKETAEALGYAQYTGLSAATLLTDAPATGHALPTSDPSVWGNRPLVALLQAEAQNIRWTDDGITTPTATIGMVLIAGDQPFLYDGPLNKLQFIRAAAGAILNVGYYR